MSGDSAGRGGDVGGAVTAVDADGEVAEGRHDRWSVAGADLGRVLAQGHVADPMQLVLDVPVCADDVGDLVRADLGLVEVCDRVDGLGLPLPAGQWPPAASDLDRESGVRKSDPDGHCGDLHGARLQPAVAFAAGHVNRRDVAPWQGLELGVQGGLIALDREQVVRAAAGQILGVPALGVQGVL